MSASPDPPRGRWSFLYGRAARISTLAGLGSVLQMVYQIAWGWIFGSGGEMDAFWTGYTIPLFLVGVLPAVLTPVGVPMLSRSHPERTEELEQLLRGNLLMAGAALALVVAVLSAPLAHLLASGMSLERQGTVRLVLLDFCPALPVLTLMLAEVVVQNAREHFVQVYLAPLGGLVLGAGFLLVFHRKLGISTLPWAIDLGWVVQTLLLIPGSRGGWKLRIDLNDAEFMGILKKGLPLSAALAYSYCDVFVERVIASHLPTGSVTVLAYAGKIVVSSASILGAGVVLTHFPELARLGGEDPEGFHRLLRRLVTRTVVLGGLGLGGLLLLAPWVIPLLFHRGAFGPEAAALLARALQLEGLVFFAGLVAMPLVYAFFALHDTRTVSIIAAAGFTVGALLKVAGAWRWGVLGVAGAASLYYLINLLAEALLLERLHGALRRAAS